MNDKLLLLISLDRPWVQCISHTPLLTTVPVSVMWRLFATSLQKDKLKWTLSHYVKSLRHFPQTTWVTQISRAGYSRCGCWLTKWPSLVWASWSQLCLLCRDQHGSKFSQLTSYVYIMKVSWWERGWGKPVGWGGCRGFGEENIITLINRVMRQSLRYHHTRGYHIERES